MVSDYKNADKSIREDFLSYLMNQKNTTSPKSCIPFELNFYNHLTSPKSGKAIFIKSQLDNRMNNIFLRY